MLNERKEKHLAKGQTSAMQMLHLKMIYQFIIYILLLNKNQINSFKCIFLFCFVYLFRFVQFFHSQTSLHSVRNVQNLWFCPRPFTEHLLQGQSRWSSLGLSALLKGKTAVVNGLSLVGLKPTTFWLTAQILNYKLAQLWGRHVRDLIMSDWGEYRTLSNYLTVVRSS